MKILLVVKTVSALQSYWKRGGYHGSETTTIAAIKTTINKIRE